MVVLLEMLGYCLITIFPIVNLPLSGAESSSSMEVRCQVYPARRYVYVHTAYAVTLLTIGFALTVLVHVAVLLPKLL